MKSGLSDHASNSYGRSEGLASPNCKIIYRVPLSYILGPVGASLERAGAIVVARKAATLVERLQRLSEV